MKIGDKEVEEVVIQAITNSFRDHQKILAELKWSPIDGCYFFHLYGMFVGVEVDGYIHS
jgi:hypothetical protein